MTQDTDRTKILNGDALEALRGVSSKSIQTCVTSPPYYGLRDINPLGRNKWSVWTVSTKPYKGAHFATFPPSLIEPCILAGSKPDDFVLDPFMGSGTTLAVALKHGRRGLGCELNPKYVNLAMERLLKVQTVL